jgi:hypothetical protein
MRDNYRNISLNNRSPNDFNCSAISLEEPNMNHRKTPSKSEPDGCGEIYNLPYASVGR